MYQIKKSSIIYYIIIYLLLLYHNFVCVPNYLVSSLYDVIVLFALFMFLLYN